MRVDRFFGHHIFFIRAVPVEMIGADVGKDGDIGETKRSVVLAESAERMELEARKLQNHHMRGQNLRKIVKQRTPDVAAEMNGEARRFEHFGDQRCGRRFAVASRHGENAGGTKR